MSDRKTLLDDFTAGELASFDGSQEKALVGPMSEAHDIEQIARVIAGLPKEGEAPNDALYWNTALACAARVLPLLSAAREEGARDMRERAIKAAEDEGNFKDYLWHELTPVGQARKGTMEAIIAAIAALPPPSIKEG